MTQAWLNRRFDGLDPDSFGEGGTWWFSAEELHPPPSFSETWTTLDRTLPPEISESMLSMRAFLILASPCNESHLDMLSDLIRVVASLGGAGPAMLWVPHTLPPEASNSSDAAVDASRNAFVTELLALGLDGIIAEEPEGLDLALAVVLQIHRAQAVLSAFNLAITREQNQQRALKFYKESIDHIKWDYLREGLGSNIPPLDPGLAPGELRSVPGYTFGAHLGAGSAGSTYMLRPDGPLGTARPQAIKVLCKSRVRHEEDLKALDSVIGLMLVLSEERWRHPNLAGLHEVYHSATHILLRMDYGGPETLHRWLHGRHAADPSGPLDLAEVTSIVGQIVRVVAHLHQGPRICHRDIKADNIIVDHTPGTTLKLIDFDLATVQSSGELCHKICGTIPFTAPEVFMDHEYDGMAADIWSEGIVLFSIQCGYHSLDKIFALPKRPSQPQSTQAGKVWSKEDGRSIKGRFAQVDFASRMMGMHCHEKLRPLLPAMQPLFAGMCSASVEQRWSAHQALHAVEHLDAHTSGVRGSAAAARPA